MHTKSEVFWVAYQIGKKQEGILRRSDKEKPLENGIKSNKQPRPGLMQTLSFCSSSKQTWGLTFLIGSLYNLFLGRYIWKFMVIAGICFECSLPGSCLICCMPLVTHSHRLWWHPNLQSNFVIFSLPFLERGDRSPESVDKCSCSLLRQNI